MDITIISKKADRLEFLLEGTTPAFANAMRRIMVAEIPVLSVDEVDFHDNTSALYDEVLAQRLGLIPIVFDPKDFNLTSECSCKGKGCSNCEAVFIIEKKGPCTVYSGDMKAANKGTKPTDPRFPIVQLLEKQALKLEAKARLGLGVRHAKHQAAIASYQYYPVVRKAKDGEKYERCPDGLLNTKGAKPAIADVTKADLEGGKCMADGYVVEMDGSKFQFRVETVSGLAPEDIVTLAAKVLEARADEFAKQAKAL
ncbi:MAG: DNA-directed RNA polymerase subunit D [Candidatus Aenigmarchaeota archaeon]|nr:DNA-directed RNA polymerase subunit D [Candidatus Aenigmarchaeota archaeon]